MTLLKKDADQCIRSACRLAVSARQWSVRITSGCHAPRRAAGHTLLCEPLDGAGNRGSGHEPR